MPRNNLARIVVCAWCTDTFATRRQGWHKYCDPRCRQAMGDYRRRGVGTLGVKPKELGFVMRPYRRTA